MGGSQLQLPRRRRLFTEYTLGQQRLLLQRALALAVESAAARGLRPQRIVVDVTLLLRALELPDNALNRVTVVNVAKEMVGERLDTGGSSWVLRMSQKRKGRGANARRIYLLILERAG